MQELIFPYDYTQPFVIKADRGMNDGIYQLGRVFLVLPQIYRQSRHWCFDRVSVLFTLSFIVVNSNLMIKHHYFVIPNKVR